MQHSPAPRPEKGGGEGSHTVPSRPGGPPTAPGPCPLEGSVRQPWCGRGYVKAPAGGQRGGRGWHYLPGSCSPRWRPFGHRSSLFPWAFLWDLIVQLGCGSGPNLGTWPLNAPLQANRARSTPFWPGHPGCVRARLRKVVGATGMSGTPRARLRGFSLGWERAIWEDASFMQEREDTPHPCPPGRRHLPCTCHRPAGTLTLSVLGPAMVPFLSSRGVREPGGPRTMHCLAWNCLLPSQGPESPGRRLGTRAVPVAIFLGVCAEGRWLWRDKTDGGTMPPTLSATGCPLLPR